VQVSKRAAKLGLFFHEDCMEPCLRDAQGGLHPCGASADDKGRFRAFLHISTSFL
jgi:hypothetical protein